MSGEERGFEMERFEDATAVVVFSLSSNLSAFFRQDKHYSASASRLLSSSNPES